jgi:hypothetical protein
MRSLRSSSEAEMVALFLRTELPSDRWKDDLRALLERAGLPDRIITAPGLGGDDLVVLEGHVRLTAFMLARDQLPPELEVLVGSSPATTRWDCWSPSPPCSRRPPASHSAIRSRVCARLWPWLWQPAGSFA